jgi:hypothetical protein
MNKTLQPDYHVLLIGIDAYSVKPLRGCVNDIDAIQRLLLGERVRIPKDRITRLASPHPASAHELTVDAKPATFDNICAALEYLGSNNMKEGDRVFVYYSGRPRRHGSLSGSKQAVAVIGVKCSSSINSTTRSSSGNS